MKLSLLCSDGGRADPESDQPLPERQRGDGRHQRETARDLPVALQQRGRDLLQGERDAAGCQDEPDQGGEGGPAQTVPPGVVNSVPVAGQDGLRSIRCRVRNCAIASTTTAGGVSVHWMHFYFARQKPRVDALLTQ